MCVIKTLSASEIMGHQCLVVEIDTQYKSINLKVHASKYAHTQEKGKQAAYRGISHHKVAIYVLQMKMII